MPSTPVELSGQRWKASGTNNEVRDMREPPKIIKQEVDFYKAEGGQDLPSIAQAEVEVTQNDRTMNTDHSYDCILDESKDYTEREEVDEPHDTYPKPKEDSTVIQNPKKEADGPAFDIKMEGS